MSNTNIDNDSHSLSHVRLVSLFVKSSPFNVERCGPQCMLHSETECSPSKISAWSLVQNWLSLYGV